MNDSVIAKQVRWGVCNQKTYYTETCKKCEKRYPMHDESICPHCHYCKAVKIQHPNCWDVFVGYYNYIFDGVVNQ